MPNTSPTYADAEAVGAFAERLETEHLTCRTLRHLWSEIKSTIRTADNGRIVWTMECDRCTALKIMTWEADGTIVSVRYRYPDGYTSEGLGRIGSTGMKALRVAVLNRFQY